MSRSGYSDEESYPGQFAMWRGQVMSAIRGKRGQQLLRELAEALDAMPVKELISKELKTAGGSYCALGVVGAKRGIDLDAIDPEDYEQVAKEFNVAHQLAQEIEYENDEGAWRETPAERWTRMRAWVEKHLQPTATPLQPSKEE